MRLFFEASEVSRKEVEEGLWRMFQADGCVVLNILWNEQEIDDKVFKGLVGVEVVFSDLELLFECVTRYGPVALELVEPDIVVFSLRDLFVVGNNLAGLVLDIGREITNKELQQSA